MTADELLNELERKELVSAEIIASLRRQVAGEQADHSADDRQTAGREGASHRRAGAEAGGAPSAAPSKSAISAAPSKSAIVAAPAKAPRKFSTQTCAAKPLPALDDLGLAPLEEDSPPRPRCS